MLSLNSSVGNVSESTAESSLQACFEREKLNNRGKTERCNQSLSGCRPAAMSRPLIERRQRESRCEAKVKRNYWERFTSFQFLVHCVKLAGKTDSHTPTHLA